MKRVMFFLAAGLLSASCRKGGAFLAEGVSYELAQHRKAAVADLRYDLMFDIPLGKEEEVGGEVTVSFSLERPEAVILDFREGEDKVRAVRVNGEQVAWKYRNEHVVLPAEAFKAGGNEVFLSFTAGSRSLNRNDDYLYTLFVPDRARTVFPCMDQPDMKALFKLTLELPIEWEAVGNTYPETENVAGGRKRIVFAQTEPLSTYLFAFAAGKLQHEAYAENGRTIGAYFRETDSLRIAQLPDIFRQVAYSLRWLEDYTGVPYPFAKYDLVILPGFQFGGMEHAGATFYNDNTLFLPAHPTHDEILSRAKLIAHETAHMWFGDAVTMAWFDDVWTKEVFANYFAAEIIAPQFPQYDPSLNTLKTYAEAAMSEDRTPGGTAIRQPLDNLCRAGLIYNQIIYNKAPLMMGKLVDLMGKGAFREGIREYVRTYLYGNAAWPDLIRILDAHTDEDLEQFSEVWVNQPGMPVVNLEMEGGHLVISQKDPKGRGLSWPQSFEVEMGDSSYQVTFGGNGSVVRCRLAAPDASSQIYPNTDGRGYGFFTMDRAQLEGLMLHWQENPHAATRQSLLMVLHENYLAGKIGDEEWVRVLLHGIGRETDVLLLSTLAGYLAEPIWHLPPEGKKMVDGQIYRLACTHPVSTCRTQLMRLSAKTATSDEVGKLLYGMWESNDNQMFSENDHMVLSYELALRYPHRFEEIVSVQRSRISNPDRLRQFDFVSRAVSPDGQALDSLFESLKDQENRRVEPWAAAVLYYLNHPLRQQRAVKYIRPALDLLPEIQRTGDIFFPGRWCSNLLSGHQSAAAYREVKAFLEEKDLPPLLKNKIVVAMFGLERKQVAASF